jgi:hypothetical protein
MGNLTDAAKNSFNKFGGKTHVPEWYRFTYLIGFTIIFFAIIFSLINEDSDIKEELNLNNKLINTNSTKLDNNSIINNIENDNNNLIDNSNIDKIKIIDTNDIYTYIPKEAFDVAKLSAEALFTGNWSDVPIYGEIPDSTIKENKIKILDSVLLSYEENNEINIIFNYKRDKKNSKIRVTVYYIDNRWVFAL